MARSPRSRTEGLFRIYRRRGAGSFRGRPLPYEEAARKISLDRYSTWLDPERIVINVASLYREFSGATASLDRMVLFAAMKRYRDACAHDHGADG
jgi:hypothetical protein